MLLVNIAYTNKKLDSRKILFSTQQIYIVSFLIFCLEALCVRLVMELESDSVVAKENIAKALRFGAHSGSQDTQIDTKKYVLDFLQKILLQREKLEAGLLKDYLGSGIATAGQEVFSTLENSNRKLLSIESGSIIFVLFCPTTSSIWQLTDDSWIKSLTLKMENLCKSNRLVSFDCNFN